MMDPNDLTVNVLREALRGMNCATSGSKSELILRLKAADPSGVWMNRALPEDSEDRQMKASDSGEAGDEASGATRVDRWFRHLST